MYPGENENILYMQEMEDRAVNQGLPPIPKEEWRLQRQQPPQAPPTQQPQPIAPPPQGQISDRESQMLGQMGDPRQAVIQALMQTKGMGQVSDNEKIGMMRGR